MINQLVKRKNKVQGSAKNRLKSGRSIPSIINERGIFCYCTCEHEVVYYSDRGIRCSKRGRLYGTWKIK